MVEYECRNSTIESMKNTIGEFGNYNSDVLKEK